MRNSGKRWWDVKNICDHTNLGRATIYRLLKAGEFPEPFRFLTRTLWEADAVEAWMNEQAAKGAGK